MDVVQARQELKKDIVNYLTSVGVTDRSVIAKALEVIKDAAFHNYPLDKDALTQKQVRECAKFAHKQEGDDFYTGLCWNFAPRHYETLVGFVVRLEEIVSAEYEAEMALERAIEEEIDRQSQGQYYSSIDEYYDELGCPDFAVIVYSDHVEVKAFESGMGDLLPKKGRKYIGNMDDVRWQFPLSALAELERLGRPVVRVSELCPAK